MSSKEPVFVYCDQCDNRLMNYQYDWQEGRFHVYRCFSCGRYAIARISSVKKRLLSAHYTDSKGLLAESAVGVGVDLLFKGISKLMKKGD